MNEENIDDYINLYKDISQTTYTMPIKLEDLENKSLFHGSKAGESI